MPPLRASSADAPGRTGDEGYDLHPVLLRDACMDARPRRRPTDAALVAPFGDSKEIASALSGGVATRSDAALSPRPSLGLRWGEQMFATTMGRQHEVVFDLGKVVATYGDEEWDPAKHKNESDHQADVARALGMAEGVRTRLRLR